MAEQEIVLVIIRKRFRRCMEHVHYASTKHTQQSNLMRPSHLQAQNRLDGDEQDEDLKWDIPRRDYAIR